MKEKNITINNVSICTESFGLPENECILLIAGATVSMLFWDDEFCELLAKNGFYVIRYDNRDVGKSTCYEPGTINYDIVDLVNDSIAILDYYNIDKANFFGISLGAMISQIATLKYPERVKTLTLMSTMPWADSDPNIPEMDKRILDFHSNASTIDWANEESVVKYMLEGAHLITGKKKFDVKRSERLIRREFNRASNYISMFNHALIQGGEEFYNRLDEIKQRALIIHGTEDLICNFKHSNELLKHLNNSKILILEGTGHELHTEDWDIIIKVVCDYIKMT